MFTKKDVRDWMIINKVYDDLDEVDTRLRRKGNSTLRVISSNFNRLEFKFDAHFQEVGHTTYNDLPDGEPTVNYLDILDAL